MAAAAGECDIPHVGNLLIVFRRPAAAVGGRRHAAPREVDPRQAAGGGRRASIRTGGSTAADEVRLLRLRPKVLSPRG